MKKNMDAQIDEYLRSVTDQMTFGEARESIRKELRSHIEELVEADSPSGISKESTVIEALKRMGDAKDLGISLNKVHQPKLDLIIPLIAILLSAVGIWNLSGSRWISLQILWIVVGIALSALLYLSTVRTFKKIGASFYGFGILCLVVSFFSGVVQGGQSYIAVADLKIKIVDLAGVLFSLGLPFIGSGIKLPQNFSKNWIGVLRVFLFLVPMAYFSLNGFGWSGLLFLVSGLCYLRMSGVSTLSFISIALGGSGMLATRFAESIVPVQEFNRIIAENAHADFALRSMREALFAEAVAGLLLGVLTVYGIKISFSIKDYSLRMVALVGISLMTVQIFTSVLANVGFLPMISAGVNIPFISYGGSGIVANFLIVGVLLGCLKRKSLGGIT